jgi:ATP-dependent exoDNAse (exonuclease V) beta subunit
MTHPADHKVRQRALDTAASFIVRAPAGSGKTRLLIQRYLALLATVDAPEEVIAITFTRKAAAEMRERVMRALDAARSVQVAEDEETVSLARAVVQRADALRWQLEFDPTRLRIQTIDALNASITRQMPLAARFGAQPESVDDADALHREAARATLALIDDDHPAAEHVAALLSHVDNDVRAAESLLARMLAAREKWLRHLHGFDDRVALEGAMQRARTRAIAEAARLFPADEKAETLALVRFSRPLRPEHRASTGVSQDDVPHAWPDPDTGEDALPVWLMAATLLLTQSGSLRKPGGVNVTAGFPLGETAQEKIDYSAWKKRMKDLLERLSGQSMDWVDAMASLRSLPDANYHEADWCILNAITSLLPVATAMLWHTFAQRGQCDFAEISQAAVRALGPDSEPTDLALALDYRIRHLLVDEFQDTSFAQFELLEKLVRGWSAGDGRTFFAVGDPMQSIYRFRNAEVGLYLRAMRFGVGEVSLEPLDLTVNFRSAVPVIEWINGSFAQLTPASDSEDLNRVPFAASSAHEDAPVHGAVSVHPLLLRDSQSEEEESASGNPGLQEATLVVQLVRAALQEPAPAKTAILVRSRTHLADIVPALKEAGIAFKAVELDPLAGRGVVRDLVALVRAMLHPADRVAWLALLRAPWCGLNSSELAMLMGGQSVSGGTLAPDARPVWDILQDESRLSALSDATRERVSRFAGQVANAQSAVHRVPLREWLEPLWLALLGPACLDQTSTLEDASAALDAIEAEAIVQTGGSAIEDFSALDRAIARLFAAPSNEARVELMTIHKAKGLEFDTVILPGLHRKTQGDARPLLVWHEEPDPQTGDAQLMIAPIREAGADDGADATYAYVQAQEKARQREEDARLLYVAATRAKRSLHLIGATKVKLEKGVETASPPPAASLLATLWPAVAADFERALNTPAVALGAFNPPVTENTNRLRQLARDAARPPLPPEIELPAQRVAPSPPARADFDWAGETARHAGSVVHLWLQNMAEEGIEHWSAERISDASQRIAVALVERGVAEADIAHVGARVADALTRTLADARGRWVLGVHKEARSEWRVSGLTEGRVAHMAIDRSFIDEQGTRWIIDFKTGTHEGGDREAFLDNERERYRAQLEGYAALVSELDRASGVHTEGAIKLGLYFPLLGGWREWEWRKGGA